MTHEDVIQEEVIVKVRLPEEGSIVPIRGELVPDKPGDEWPAEVREDLYQCYKLTRGISRAIRWYSRLAGEGAPAPAKQTVSGWIKYYRWDDRAEAEYRLEHGKMLYETERQSLANYVVALHVEADVLTGEHDADPMVGALRLKASEIAQRRHERKIKTMAPIPPAEEVDNDELPRDEREALARGALVQRVKER